MPATDNTGLVALTVAVYVLALWVPGGVVGAAAGMRGWLLAAVAPLLTYTTAGVLGPTSTALGLPWNLPTLLGCTVVIAAALYGVHLLADRRVRLPTFSTLWSRKEQLVTTGGVVLAVLIGAAVVAGATGNLAHIPQDWDAAFHANGIRYIAQTGDASLTGMSTVNWYEIGGLFYPNAYHLIGAQVLDLTGTQPGIVLNAQTVLLPGMLALGLVALIRYCRGGALTAAFSALVAASSLSALYDLFWRGPLLPFATGNVLSPAFVLLAVHFLDNRRVDTGLAFALGAVGMLAVHPSNLFSGIAFVLPLLASRWLRDRHRIWPELRSLALAAAVGIALAAPLLLGSIASAQSQPLFKWDADFPVSRSIGALLTFQHMQPFPQYWLALPLWIGLVMWRRMREMRWLIGTAALFSVLFVLSASYPGRLALALTRPWWNDQWRLIALAAIPLSVVAGHGMTTLCEWLSRLIRTLLPSFRPRIAVATAVVFLAFAVLTKGFYYRLNTTTMAHKYGDGPVVSTGEYRAMRALSTLVRPGERVMNDRGDGSVWMYAIAGTHPVAGHYDANRVGPDPKLLEQHFDEYDTDPAVRAAAARLHVHYVLVGKGYVRPWLKRVTGLRELRDVRELQLVYRNPDAAIYRLDGYRQAP